MDGLGLEKDLDFVNGVPRFRQDESVSNLIVLRSQWRIVGWLVFLRKRKIILRKVNLDL